METLLNNAFKISDVNEASVCNNWQFVVWIIDAKSLQFKYSTKRISGTARETDTCELFSTEESHLHVHRPVI